MKAIKVETVKLFDKKWHVIDCCTVLEFLQNNPNLASVQKEKVAALKKGDPPVYLIMTPVIVWRISWIADIKTVQLAAGSMCKVETHALSGKKVRYWDGRIATVIGKRHGADARRRYAFVIAFCYPNHAPMFLASRRNFTVIDDA